MSFYWGCRTDEQIVARVRYWHVRQMKWRRVIYAFIVLAILLLLTMVAGEIPQISHLWNRTLTSSSANVRLYSTGYFVGLAFGTVFGGALTFCVSGLFFVAADLKRDRLLLAYHDRLREAGLLPAEASGKMEPDHETQEA